MGRNTADGEPVAIIGIGCRLPGGIDGPDALWQRLRDGVDAVREVPPDRWRVEDWLDEDVRAPGRTTTRWGAFLDDVAGFDADFFRISPVEAKQMDPQQRVALEVAWAAVEDARIAPDRLRGTATGVYLGTMWQEYHLAAGLAPADLRTHSAVGADNAVIPGRVAYALGLRGPVMAVATACSSSLTAVHLAARSVATHESELALAGGVNLTLHPAATVAMTKFGAMNPDGRCRAFDAGAAGYVRGEGCGVVVLRRLADAVAAGDRIYAVVLGSAVNNDGATANMTVPDEDAQADLMRTAWRRAGVQPREVSYVEAHGTGTAVGDPIEAAALRRVFAGRPTPLRIGSVKTNLGHLEAASGIAGLLKTALAVHHGELPANLHFERPNPAIDFTGLSVVTEHAPWPGPRYAGVSSFGYGGSNAHVALGPAPTAAKPAPAFRSAAASGRFAVGSPGWAAAAEGLAELAGTTGTAVGTAGWAAAAEGLAELAGSAGTAVGAAGWAATAEGLAELAGTAGTAVGSPDWAAADEGLAGSAGTAVESPGWVAAAEGLAELAGAEAAEASAVGGTAGPLPWVLSARTPAALRDQARLLDEHLRARPHLSSAAVARTLATARASFEERAVVFGARGLAALAAGTPSGSVVVGTAGVRGVVFVFPGQGSQWVGMALRLADESPVFAARLRACGRAIASFVDWDLLEALADPEALHRVDVVQPALWAVMVSLAELWRAHGVEPAAVVGHSQGEIAAACVAGGLSIEDGARIVTLRAAAIRDRLAGRGGMVSVALPRAEVPVLDGLSVAAVNGPDATVVAGETAVLDEFLAWCESRGVRARRVPVDYASHSAAVEDVRAELAVALAPVRPRAGRIPMFSTVTGDWIDTTELTAGYWYDNLRNTVEFDAAVTALAGHLFVETSPHPVLTPGIPGAATGTLRRGDGGLDRVHTALANAHVHGAPVDWSTVLPPATLVDLPTYPFQHQRFWPDTAPVPPVPAAPAGRRHVEDWRRIDEPEPAATGAWLALVPTGARDAARDVLGAVTDRLDTVPVPVAPGTDRAALAATLADAARGASVAGVLSLLALDTAPHPDLPAVPAGHPATLTALQALGDAGITARLWCLTRTAVTPGRAEPVDPAQRTVWGLGRVAALEHGDRWGGLVDLPATCGQRTWQRIWRRLVAVLTGDHGEDQLLLRGDGVFARRLVRDTGPAADWRPTGTVLVTGGTGALGTHVAGWLADHGAERLVLVSRTGAADPGTVERLRAAGAEVAVEACDVADRAALRDLLDRTGPLTAVFHTAAVLDDAALDRLTPDQVDRVHRVKAGGARHLHELTEDMPLTAFVLFSSIGATTGIPGQGNYAPGNAYLDGLAEARHAEGLPATSIAWGPWAGAGMAGGSVADGTVADVLTRHGVPPMAPEHALAELAAAIGTRRPCVTVADVRWDRFATVFTATRRSRLLDELVTAEHATGSAAGTTAGTTDGTTDGTTAGEAVAVRSPLAVLASAGRAVLLELVRAHTAAVLDHADGSAVPPRRSFKELGFDSVLGVELRNRLSAATGLALPATAVFEHPTPAALAEHLGAELTGPAPAEPDHEEPGGDLSGDLSGDLPGDLADADDDELFRLIDEKYGAR